MRIELYHFRIVRNSSSQAHPLTSSSKSIDFNGLTFDPAPIGRGKIVSSSDINKAKMEVKISLSNAFAFMLIGDFVDAVVSLDLYTKIDNGIPTITWKGRMASMGAEGKVLTLTFETAFTAMRRFGLRKKFQRTCPHSLYGGGCKVKRSSFSDDETVVSVEGPDLVFSNNGGKVSGFFSGGLVEASDGSVRYIEAHTGSSLTLSRPLKALSVGQSIKVSAGCNKTRDVCHTRFSNVANYGGFPFIPTKNPFGGSSIA